MIFEINLIDIFNKNNKKKRKKKNLNTQKKRKKKYIREHNLILNIYYILYSL